VELRPNGPGSLEAASSSQQQPQPDTALNCKGNICSPSLARSTGVAFQLIQWLLLVRPGRQGADPSWEVRQLSLLRNPLQALVAPVVACRRKGSLPTRAQHISSQHNDCRCWESLLSPCGARTAKGNPFLQLMAVNCYEHWLP
jgi:hypothetical protein